MARKQNSRGKRVEKVEGGIEVQLQGLSKGAADPAAILANHRVIFLSTPTPLSPRCNSDAHC